MTHCSVNAVIVNPEFTMRVRKAMAKIAGLSLPVGVILRSMAGKALARVPARNLVLNDYIS
ncbi:hypothetical protein GCM10011507_34650 [Edaphobacter acidisoli]|uniref:Uncharacterized protein n=1 Tax=Edaphobacter acidisoli TaxID=2040573 RepID=A0A916S328_9BACT|nr:hypothetical protein GCM10011507_34650 [Edaphobacter acidisoli]